MLRFVVRRVLVAVPLLVAASILSFALTTAMGDPLGEWKAQRPRTEQEIATQYARDRLRPARRGPLPGLGGRLRARRLEDHGDARQRGRGRPALKIRRAFWVTFRLVVAAEIIALGLGMVVGVIGAVRQYSRVDYGSTGLAFLMFSIPLFCVAVIVKFAGIRLNDWLESVGLGRWLITAGPPPGGFSGGLGQQVYQYTGAYVLPTLCLVAVQFALYSRFQRASMLDALNADYVRTARAKGLGEPRVVVGHALRNALIPILTVFSLNFGLLLGGAIITETVFGWRGMGTLIVDAIAKKEPWMVQGWMMVTAAFVIAANLVADVVYSYLDPRIRLE